MECQWFGPVPLPPRLPPIPHPYPRLPSAWTRRPRWQPPFRRGRRQDLLAAVGVARDVSSELS